MTTPRLVRISRKLARDVDALSFGPPVTHVYDPLDYARTPHEEYLRWYGDGPKEVVLVGMNPGPFGMAQTGVPFGDVSMVRDWMGIDRETFYDARWINIIPMGFCYPGRNPRGGDNPPRPECARLWHARLFAALPPQDLILVIGQYAQAFHLGRRRQKTLTNTVRHWRAYLPSYLPLPHPSPRNTYWLQQNPWFEAEVIPELRRRVAAILAADGQR